MSEPTHFQLKNIVEIFLKEYNKENNASFKWDNNKSYVAKFSDKKWVDALVYDKKGKELQLQHKEIIWDIKADKIRNGATNKIVKKLKETMTSHGLWEVTVHLNFHQNNIISSDKDINEFCFWVVELIGRKLSYGYPKSNHLFLLPKTIQGYWIRIISTFAVFFRGIKDSFYIAIDKPNKVRQHIYSYNNNDNTFLDKIKEITSYISIFRNPEQKEPVVGWGYSELEPRPLPHFGDVVVSEINRKVVNKYNDLIVLLDCNRPVDDYDRELIFTQVKHLSFSGQIWIVENFLNKQKATCIFKSKKILN